MQAFIGYMYLFSVVLVVIVSLVYWATHPKDYSSF